MLVFARALMLGMIILVVPQVQNLRIGVNLIPDGGFELKQWNLANWDEGEGELSFSNKSRSGENAVKLTGISDEEGNINILAYSQPIDVQEGHDYVLSAWYRSTGDAVPLVTVSSYKEKWASAQWETPKTDSQTRGLAKTQNWTPYTLSFRTVPGTVQILITVRNSGVGSVWFDDVALYEKETNYALVKVLEKGTITALPDKRRLKVDISSSNPTTPWKLSLLEDSTGKQIASGIGAGSEPSFLLDYTAPEHTPLVLVLEDYSSGAVLVKRNFQPPPHVQLELISSRYRNSVFLSQEPQNIPARLICHFDNSLVKNMRFALQPQDDQAPDWQALNPVNDVTFPLSEEAETVKLSVLLDGVPDYDSCSMDVTLVKPTEKGREVIVGENNELLVDGHPFFPTGFYSPKAGSSFDPIAKAGYTASLTYTSNPKYCLTWLDDCQRLGLLGVVSVPRPFVTSFNESELREAIRAVKQHPALLAYYLFDEPSPNLENQSPDDLKRVYDVVADEDPYHPVALCIWNPDWFSTYHDCYDILMTDPYPIQKIRQPLTKISQWLDEGRVAVSNRKPVWIVNQSFGWDIIENIPDPRYITPTPQQERCMTYLGLTHGPSAVMYYSYHTYTMYDAEKKEAGLTPYGDGGYLPEKQPLLWSALIDLGGELRALSPALMLPGSQEGIVGSVHWRLTPKDTNECAWLIAVNANEKVKAEVVVSLDEKTNPQLVYGTGTISSEGEKVLLTLPPMGTIAACCTTKNN